MMKNRQSKCCSWSPPQGLPATPNKQAPDLACSRSFVSASRQQRGRFTPLRLLVKKCDFSRFAAKLPQPSHLLQQALFQSGAPSESRNSAATVQLRGGDAKAEAHTHMETLRSSNIKKTE